MILSGSSASRESVPAEAKGVPPPEKGSHRLFPQDREAKEAGWSFRPPRFGRHRLSGGIFPVPDGP
jgi:uncharacterized protein (DUF58 family)